MRKAAILMLFVPCIAGIAIWKTHRNRAVMHTFQSIILNSSDVHIDEVEFIGQGRRVSLDRAKVSLFEGLLRQAVHDHDSGSSYRLRVRLSDNSIVEMPAYISRYCIGMSLPGPRQVEPAWPTHTINIPAESDLREVVDKLLEPIPSGKATISSTNTKAERGN